MTRNAKSRSVLLRRRDHALGTPRVRGGPGGGGAQRADGRSCTRLNSRRADRLRGGSGADLLCGLGGNDVMSGVGGGGCGSVWLVVRFGVRMSV